MSNVRRVVGLASVLLFLSACGGGGSGDGGSGGGTQPTSFTVSTTTTGTGSGTISPTSRSVTQGSTTSFTISPGSGSSIGSVSGCGGSLSGSTYTTGPINGSCTVSATFDLNTYTVTATAGSGGSISPASANVTHGDTAAFSVTPSSGFAIDSVSGCGGALSGSTYTTGPITAACTVTSSFRSSGTTPPPPAGSFTVTTTTTGTGSGTISPTQAVVPQGQTATFQVVPSTGSTIASVTGCGGSLSGSTYTTGAINSDCVITAGFILNTYTVTATAFGGGSISPSTVSVEHGSTIVFSVAPDVGHSINIVSGCGGSLAGTNFTTAPIVAPCSVSAEFVPNTYQVTTASGLGGRIFPSEAVVQHGDVFSFNVTVDCGYVIQRVEGCDGQLDAGTYTTGQISGACTVTAEFALADVREVSPSLCWATGAAGGGDYGPTASHAPPALAADGSVITAGTMQLTATFGEGDDAVTIYSPTPSLYLARYYADGGLAWVVNAKGPGTSEPYALAVDTSGNIFVSGSFQGDVTFGDGADASTLFGWPWTFFLARYRPDGTLEWIETTQVPGTATGRSISLDVDGGIIVTGTFSGDVTFGSGDNAVNLASGGDIRTAAFVVRYRNDRTLDWAWSGSTPTQPSANEQVVGASVGSDLSGRISATGTFVRYMTFSGMNDGKSLYSDTRSMFLVSLDSIGEIVWSESTNGTGLSEGNATAIDTQGNVYVSGTYGGQITFGAGTINAVTLDTGRESDTGIYSHVFLARYRADGSLMWVVGTEGEGRAYSTDLVVSPGGDVITTGAFEGTVHFGSGDRRVTVDPGRADRVGFFVARYTSSGELVWVEAITAGGGYIRGVAVSDVGTFAVSGAFSQFATFGKESNSITLENVRSNSVNKFLAMFQGLE